MNSIVFLALLFVTTVFGDEALSKTWKAEVNQNLNVIHRRINLFERHEFKELQHVTLPMELEYFAYKIKYDEPILTMRKELLKKLSETDRDTAEECYRQFNKKLHSLVYSEGESLQRIANHQLADLSSQLLSSATEMRDMQETLDNEIRLTATKKVSAMNTRVDELMKDVLDIPSIMHTGWTTFEKSSDIDKLVEETRNCFETEKISQRIHPSQM